MKGEQTEIGKQKHNSQTPSFIYKPLWKLSTQHSAWQSQYLVKAGLLKGTELLHVRHWLRFSQ